MGSEQSLPFFIVNFEQLYASLHLYSQTLNSNEIQFRRTRR